jgi:hypothetical protein
MIRLLPILQMTTAFDILNPLVSFILLIQTDSRQFCRRNTNVSTTIRTATRTHLIIVSSPFQQIRESTSNSRFDSQHSHDCRSGFSGQKSEYGFSTSSLECPSGRNGCGSFSLHLLFMLRRGRRDLWRLTIGHSGEWGCLVGMRRRDCSVSARRWSESRCSITIDGRRGSSTLASIAAIEFVSRGRSG